MDPSCNECIKGTIHKGQPQGTEEIIHGLNTYIVGNRNNARGIIVIYSDIFGLLLPNNKLIADAYAKSGDWLVYLPDFFQGDPVQLKFADVAIPVDAAKQSTFAKYTGLLACAPSFMMWMMRHKQEPTNKVCMDFLTALRKSTSQKIGMVGFCWGGKYAIRAGLQSNMVLKGETKMPLVDAIVALHPSNLTLPADVEELVVPVTIGWGLKDEGVKIEQKGIVEEIHAKASAKDSGKKMPEIVHRVYEPGRHGFAVRGNPDDPLERKCLEDSLAQALQWMDKWL